MCARVCANGTDSSEGVMHPDSFEGVFRIDTVEGVHSCVCMCMVQPTSLQFRVVIHHNHIMLGSCVYLLVSDFLLEVPPRDECGSLSEVHF